MQSSTITRPKTVQSTACDERSEWCMQQTYTSDTDCTRNGRVGGGRYFTINRQRKTAKISGKNSLQSSQRSVRAISLIIEAVKQQKSIFITHIQKLPAVQWELFHFCGVLLQLGCKNTDKSDNNVPTGTFT